MKKNIILEFKQLFWLAVPLIFNLLSYMAMQLVDTLMLGMLGPKALAAAALGNIIFITTLIICIGVLSAISALVANAFGNGNQQEAANFARQGIWLAVFLSVPGILIINYAPNFLKYIGQANEIIQVTQEFLSGLIWGFLPALCYVALREFISAISKPRIVLVISLVAIPINALANYLLMYGKLGLPAYGIKGVGLATSLVEWGMFFAIAIYITFNSHFADFKIFKHLQKPHFGYLKKIFTLGWPIGVTFGVEEFLFVVAAILVGYFGINSLAAHQIAIQCTTAAIGIPIGIAQATTIRVSQLIGAKDQTKAILSAYIGLGFGLVLALLVACSFWFLGKPIVSLFLNVADSENRQIIGISVTLLAISAVFHVVDALQIITNGILRGFQDTFIPMLLGLFSFWVVGIGSGYYLGFLLKFGIVGIWWGLALGVTFSALLLQWRFKWHRDQVYSKSIS